LSRKNTLAFEKWVTSKKSFMALAPVGLALVRHVVFLEQLAGGLAGPQPFDNLRKKMAFYKKRKKSYILANALA